jgi:hypothetical protein
VVVVAIAKAVKRPPQHPLWLVEAAALCDQALLDLRDCQVRTIFRVGALGSSSQLDFLKCLAPGQARSAAETGSC